MPAALPTECLWCWAGIAVSILLYWDGETEAREGHAACALTRASQGLLSQT